MDDFAINLVSTHNATAPKWQLHKPFLATQSVNQIELKIFIVTKVLICR